VAANYSVNIHLDTKSARDALDTLEKRVNTLRRNLNAPIKIESKATLIKQKQVALEDKKFAMMHRTRRLGDQLIRFEEQGLKVGRLKLEIMNAARHTDKEHFQTAKDALKFVADELKTIEKQTQAKVKNAGVDKQKLRDLDVMIRKKRLELSLIRTAGKVADFNARQRKGIGPNNLLGLPSTEKLKPEKRGIEILDLERRPNEQREKALKQATKDRSTALGLEKKLEDLRRRANDRNLGLKNNQEILNNFAKAGLGIQSKKFDLVKEELSKAELLIATAKKNAAANKQINDSMKQAETQSQKRFGMETKIRELEAKGVNTAKIRVKMGEVEKAQNKGEFTAVKKLNKEIGAEIARENSKLKILKLQNKERMEANKLTEKESVAQGPFSRISERGLRSSESVSRDVEGRRTFMNNPLVGGVSRVLPRFMQPTKGFDVGSAMISGGFPLLFGQGPVTAAAGALGGGIGGMFGQMGGFAGGIAATSLVQSINQALTAMSELGKAMGPFTQNSQALTDSLGLQGSAEEARIRLIEQSEGKTAAFNASMQLMATRIGEDGVKNLEEFGETTRLLGSELSLATTQLQALGAAAANAALNFLGLTERLEKSAATRSVADAAARGDTTAQDLVGRRKEIEAMRGQGGEGKRKQILLDILEAEEKIFAIREKTAVQADVATTSFDSMVRSLKAENEEAQRLVDLREKGINPAIAKTIAGLEKEASLAKDILKVKMEEIRQNPERKGILNENELAELETYQTKVDEIDKALAGTTKLVKETNELNDVADKTADAFKAIGEEIENSIKDNLRDAITGAQSLGDAVGNVLDSIKNKILDTILDNAFDGLGGGISGLFGKIFPMAKGGPVMAGGRYLVGERGPELFTPGNSGNIIPNDKLISGGSSVTNNISISVDASNSDVQSDSGGQQFGDALATAIQLEIVKQKRSGGLLA